jgi:hypothetical protein
MRYNRLVEMAQAKFSYLAHLLFKRIQNIYNDKKSCLIPYYFIRVYLMPFVLKSNHFGNIEKYRSKYAGIL